jgi:hypothetical protein
MCFIFIDEEEVEKNNKSSLSLVEKYQQLDRSLFLTTTGVFGCISLIFCLFILNSLLLKNNIIMLSIYMFIDICYVFSFLFWLLYDYEIKFKLIFSTNNFTTQHESLLEGAFVSFFDYFFEVS